MNIKKNNFKNSPFWDKLLIQQKLLTTTLIAKLFIEDPNRFQNFSLRLPELNLLFDFSKQHLNNAVLEILYDAAKYCELTSRIEALFKGEKINYTEHRSVGHHNLRVPDPTQDITVSLSKMHDIATSIYNSNITDVLCLGIGGSYLGPKMVCEALDNYTSHLAKKIKFHFIANNDYNTLNTILSGLYPDTTALIISSKSFTTAETIKNAIFIRDWFAKQQTPNASLSKMFAITSNINKAIEFGIYPENILSFNDNIGGRYSVWSVVGLPIVIKLGIDNFKKFLQGGSLIDEHFTSAPLKHNIPVTMGLISVWNINFMRYKSLAVIPYLDALESFPEYLQQLTMESNGKSVGISNNLLDYDTAEIIFGGVGCNVQHSFMQMLHQGTQNIPVDFLLVAEQQKFLFANCLAQSQALMQGTNHISNSSEILSDDIEIFKYCRGNKPSSTILFNKLTPETLGGLIALYEHKTFVQSVMWDLNAFDQWGVELGKKLANDILKKFEIRPKRSSINSRTTVLNEKQDLLESSMQGLIQEYLRLNNEKN